MNLIMNILFLGYLLSIIHFIILFWCDLGHDKIFGQCTLLTPLLPPIQAIYIGYAYITEKFITQEDRNIQGFIPQATPPYTLLGFFLYGTGYIANSCKPRFYIYIIQCLCIMEFADTFYFVFHRTGRIFPKPLIMVIQTCVIIIMVLNRSCECDDVCCCRKIQHIVHTKKDHKRQWIMCNYYFKNGDLSLHKVHIHF